MVNGRGAAEKEVKEVGEVIEVMDSRILILSPQSLNHLPYTLYPVIQGWSVSAGPNRM